MLRNLKKVSVKLFCFRKATKNGREFTAKPLDNHFFRNKRIALIGEFFPMNNITLTKNLLSTGANIDSKITPDTEILICGKFPNWTMVEQAKAKGVQLIFVDKAGELFTVILSRMNEGKSFNYEEPLGV